uniref:Uncharacterized protein n=1 Tax=Oryza brachyantha TaxID=4533 RepID=J3LYJ2_ORYBR
MLNSPPSMQHAHLTGCPARLSHHTFGTHVRMHAVVVTSDPLVHISRAHARTYPCMHSTLPPPCMSCASLDLEAEEVRRAGELEPRRAVDERPGGELLGLLLADDPESLPVDALAGAGAGAAVVVLGVVERVEREVAVPGHVPFRLDEVGDGALHDDEAGVLLPWPAEVGRDLEPVGEELLVGDEAAVLDDEAGLHVGVGAAVRRHRVLLVVHRAAGDDEAVLEHGSGVSEDEVDGAGDDAVAEELAPGVHVQRVLERVEPAVVEGREVALHAQPPRLVALRAGRVVEPHVLADEPGRLDGEGGRLHGGDAVGEALAAGDAAALGPVAVHEDVDLVLGDHDDLVVQPGLHVDDVPARVALGHRVHGLLDGLELATPVLGHHRVGLRPVAVAGGEQLPVGRLHPRREAAHHFLLRQKAPARERVTLEHVEVELLEDGAEAVGDGERVAAELAGIPQHLLHVGLELLVGEPVGAGVHEGHDAGEPVLEVVGAAEQHLDVPAGHLDHASEVVHRVLKELLAVLARALRHGVARLGAADVLGPLHRRLDRLERHLGDGREHLAGVLGAIGGRGERLLARLLVQRGRAQGLDGLAGGGEGGLPRDGEVVPGLVAGAGHRGDHPDDDRDDEDRPHAPEEKLLRHLGPQGCCGTAGTLDL